MAKIVHIITRMDMGGSAQNTLDTCLGTCHCHEVVLIHGLARESGMTPSEEERVAGQLAKAQGLGVRVCPLATLVRQISPLQDVLAFWSILRLLIRERPQIVHTHTSKAGILGRLAAWLLRVPNIIHTPHGHVFYGHFASPTARIFLLVERICSRMHHRLVALTEGERQDYLRLNLCPDEKMHTIHSGVPIDRFLQARPQRRQGRQAVGVPPDSLVVGTVGWLLPMKGPGYLLEAMHLLDQRSDLDWRLVYVGKGDLEEELRQRTRELGLEERVIFLGWRKDIEQLMPLFDLFALPSLNEGMGRVLVEAMAAGLPLVASRVGGVIDLVRHGENGLLVDAADAQGLAEAIHTILTDPVKARAMGQAGLSFCHRFSLAAMLERLLDLYDEVLLEGAKT